MLLTNLYWRMGMTLCFFISSLSWTFHLLGDRMTVVDCAAVIPQQKKIPLTTLMMKAGEGREFPLIMSMTNNNNHNRGDQEGGDQDPEEDDDDDDEEEQMDVRPDTKEIEETLDKIMENYDKNIPPTIGARAGVRPVEVRVQILVNEIDSISELNSELRLDLDWKESWIDPRLQYEVSPETSLESGVRLGAKYGDKIWRPSTIFSNGKKLTTTEEGRNTQSAGFILLFPNGRVLTSTRIFLTTSCHFSLSNYPMDQHVCSVQLQSLGYSKNDIDYVWGLDRSSKGGSSMFYNSAYPEVNKRSTPDFQPAAYRLTNNSRLDSGDIYSILSMEMILRRLSLGSHLVHAFIPASILVMVSWLSMWMGSSSQRLTLNVVLNVIILYIMVVTTTSHQLPNCLKAVDIYLSICFLTLFLSMVQSAIVGWLAWNERQVRDEEDRLRFRSKSRYPHSDALREMKEKKMMSTPWIRQFLHQQYGITMGGHGKWESGSGVDSAANQPPLLSPETRPNNPPPVVTHSDHEFNYSHVTAWMDMVSRIILPLLFVTFNVVFWKYFLNAGKIYKSRDEESWLQPN